MKKKYFYNLTDKGKLEIMKLHGQDKVFYIRLDVA